MKTVMKLQLLDVVDTIFGLSPKSHRCMCRQLSKRGISSLRLEEKASIIALVLKGVTTNRRMVSHWWATAGKLVVEARLEMYARVLSWAGTGDTVQCLNVSIADPHLQGDKKDG